MLRGLAVRRFTRRVMAAAFSALLSSLALPVAAQIAVPSVAETTVTETVTETAEVSPQNINAIISDVQIVGNHSVSNKAIRAELDTRAGERLDSFKLQRDVRNLTKLQEVFDVKVKTQPSAEPDSIVVIFEVFEFPKLEYLYFIGNKELSSRVLKKKVGTHRERSTEHHGRGGCPAEAYFLLP